MKFVSTIAMSLSLALLASGAALAQKAPAAAMPEYSFLKNTIWYVPQSTLPAPEMNPQDGTVRMLSDQTVWRITNYHQGYFWGNIVAQLRNGSGKPVGDPTCMRMMASVTPDGKVLATFIPPMPGGAVLAVRGDGTLTMGIDKSWRFEMQMSSGLQKLVAHWSYMVQCKEGDACNAQLPGTDLSLPSFLALCTPKP